MKHGVLDYCMFIFTLILNKEWITKCIILFFCFQVMLDTVGAELQVVNKCEKSISLLADGFVVLTPYQDQEASSELLPINFNGLAKV